jgi:hypothetical protein
MKACKIAIQSVLIVTVGFRAGGNSVNLRTWFIMDGQ